MRAGAVDDLHQYVNAQFYLTGALKADKFNEKKMFSAVSLQFQANSKLL
jgi:hypothetical protein